MVPFFRLPAGVVLAVSLAAAAPAAELDREAVNAATWEGTLPDDQSAIALKLQVLLDRAGISPGVIDGYPGQNVSNAIAAFERREGLTVDGVADDEVWARLDAGGPVLIEYTVTAEDMEGPFVDAIPEEWEARAEMEVMGWTSVGEMLAERHHMDIDLFEALNGGLDFAAGDTVTVADPGGAAEAKVARIVVSKSDQTLSGLDEAGELVAHYPATVGSSDLPSPSGTHTVKAIAPDPNYTFDPKNLPEADADQKLIIPPGPNGPVGSMWIDLSEPTYGIHGTSDPASIGKAASHGCVRLTNWDAEELAGRIDTGIEVEFVE